jgi:hypothetical protein
MCLEPRFPDLSDEREPAYAERAARLAWFERLVGANGDGGSLPNCVPSSQPSAKFWSQN